MINRPKMYDNNVRELTVHVMMPTILTYLEDAGVNDQTISNKTFCDKVRSDMVSALLYDNVKEMCRYLVSVGWAQDKFLTEITTSVNNARQEELQKVVKNWVRNNKITAQHSIGQSVGFKRNNTLYRGEITQIKEDVAQYVVFCAALGHVREGVGINGTRVNYEDVAV